MAVAHDADSIGDSGSTVVASLTWSHTCTGSNLLLVVAVAFTGSNDVSATYNGVAMTANPFGKIAATGTYSIRIFTLVNPTTGAHNVVITPSSGTLSIYGGGTSFAGVDQTNPTPDVTSLASQSGQNSRTITLVTTIPNEMLFAIMGLANATSTLSTDAPATEAFNVGNTTAARRALGSYLLTTTAGSNSISQFISGVTARSYAQIMIGINEVGGSASVFKARSLPPILQAVNRTVNF